MPGELPSFALDAGERDRLASDGFLVRENVFDGKECAAIAADCEALLSDLIAAKRGEAAPGSAAAALRDAGVFVKWEPGAPDVLLGIEPFAHLSPALHDWGLDPRLTQAATALVGADQVALFTEKLNVKRARKGGPIVLHQDFPYWEDTTPVAHRIGTAMIFLDEATLENGCLEVAPGSHLAGKHRQKQLDGVTRKEMDPDLFDLDQLIPVEVPAGSVVFFGAFLVHRSLPNHSAHDRRALLYSYQPHGHPHGRELHHALSRKGQAAAVG